MDCTSLDTDIHINTILHSHNINDDLTYNKFKRIMHSYPGPDFHALDERLQTSLVDYFAELGVNEHLAAFIEVMSLDKDQRVYMRWLQKLQD